MSSRLVCTIITKPYWAHARVLAESLREHNPQLPPLLVLLADRLDGYFDPTHEPFQLVRLEELPDQEQVAAMSFYYTPFEFCNALRPVFHDYILNCTEAESWIYLDSDILILHSLDDIFNQIENHSIVLSPHLTAPTDPCDVETEEFPILHGGIYNSGCLGLHRTAETRAFVAWFKDRLRWFCFQDHKNGFVDQGWLNYVPLFFGDVSFLVTQGANLGHWRLRGHRISKKKERFHVDSNPLIFMHFSGWSPDVSELVSVYNSSLSPEECVGWKEIAALYESLLRQEFSR